MKCLIVAIEKFSTEVHDDLYNYFCELKNQQSNEDEDRFAFKHFLYSKECERVTIKEATAFISNGTTGLCTWEAAIKLAEWGVCNKSHLVGKNILELGSGSGFAGICIGKACHPKLICLSDCHEKVLELLRENVGTNGLSDTVKVLNITWGEPLDVLQKMYFLPDFLLASDIIYDDSLFETLLKTINEIFELNPKCVFILSCTVRNQTTLNKFLSIFKKCQKRWQIQEEYVKEIYEFKLMNPNQNSIVKIYRIKI